MVLEGDRHFNELSLHSVQVYHYNALHNRYQVLAASSEQWTVKYVSIAYKGIVLIAQTRHHANVALVATNVFTVHTIVVSVPHHLVLTSCILSGSILDQSESMTIGAEILAFLRELVFVLLLKCSAS